MTARLSVLARSFLRRGTSKPATGRRAVERLGFLGWLGGRSRCSSLPACPPLLRSNPSPDKRRGEVPCECHSEGGKRSGQIPSRILNQITNGGPIIVRLVESTGETFQIAGQSIGSMLEVCRPVPFGAGPAGVMEEIAKVVEASDGEVRMSMVQLRFL
jgi:hypothetical protein